VNGYVHALGCSCAECEVNRDRPASLAMRELTPEDRAHRVAPILDIQITLREPIGVEVTPPKNDSSCTAEVPHSGLSAKDQALDYAARELVSELKEALARANYAMMVKNGLNGKLEDVITDGELVHAFLSRWSEG
jgi:hypothetical protein